VKKLSDWFKGLSKVGKAGVIFGVIIILGIFSNIVSPPEETAAPPKGKIVVEQPAEKTEEAEEATVEEVVEEKPAENPEPEIAALKIGDTGQGENWDYTVNSFDIKDKLTHKETRGSWQEDKFTQEYCDPIEAGEGQKFLIVNVTVKNKAKETKDTTEFLFDFKALAAGDYVFDECTDGFYSALLVIAMGNDHKALSSINLKDVAPGGSATGDVVFKICADATDLQFKAFKAGFDDLVWNLQ